MKTNERAAIAAPILAFIFAALFLAGLSLAACKNPSDDVANQTPTAADYTIGKLTQTAGSVTAVTITPKSGKSTGAVTIYYAKSKTLPMAAGTYAVTFDVAAAAGWNAAAGLSAGTLTINAGNPVVNTTTPVVGDYEIGNLTQTVGNVIAVTVRPKSGKSTGAVTVYYNGSTTLPTAAGTYAVTFDVAAASGFNAVKGLSAGTLTINATNNIPTPTAADYNIGNMTQTAGNVTAVTITPKSGKSTGAVTIYYNGSTTLPTAVGNYSVTFDVATASGWNATTGLNAGTFIIGSPGNRSPAAADYEISGTGTFTYDGSVKTVTVTAKLGKSAGTVTVKYNNGTAAPSAVGIYTVTFDVAEASGWNAASSLSAGTLTITNPTPVADDFTVSNLTQTAGNITPVIISPKPNKSTGTITIRYNGSTILPTTAGSYTVTFDVAVATGWNEAAWLAAGTLVINPVALWARSVSAGDNASLFNAVAVDASGNVYAAGGQSTGTYTYGAGVSAQGIGAVLVKYNSSGAAQWARSVENDYPSNRGSRFTAVAVDASGNVYAAGCQYGIGTYTYGTGVSVQGTANFYIQDGFYNYYDNVVLVKYNANGEAQWARTVSAGSSDSRFYAVAVDALGNVYAAGSQKGTGSYAYSAGVSAQGTDSGENEVLVKYNSSGTALWAKTASEGGGRFNAVAVDSSGNVYAAGRSLVKYNSSGTVLWAETAREGHSSFNAVAVDSSGNVYAAGSQFGDYSSSSSSYGPGVSVQGSGVVLVKYNSSGTAQWARTSSGGLSTTGIEFNAVAVDSSGNVYAAGIQQGGTYTYGPEVSAQGPYDFGSNVLLVKYNTSGTAQWARTVSAGDNASRFNAVAVDSSGSVYAAGYQSGNSIFTYDPGVSAQGTFQYLNEVDSYISYNVVLVKYKN